MTAFEEKQALDKQIEKLTADADALMAARDAAVAERDASVKAAADMKAASEKAVSDLAAAIEAHKAELVEHGKALEAEKAERAKLADDLAKAHKALANPAFADAAARGTVSPAPAGMSAADQVEFKSQAEALAAYKKIEGARERAEFRKQHKDILGL